MSPTVVSVSKPFITLRSVNKARGMCNGKLVLEGIVVEPLSNCSCNKIWIPSRSKEDNIKNSLSVGQFFYKEMTKVCETESSYSAKLLYEKLEHVRKCLYEKGNSSKEEKVYYRIQKLFKLEKKSKQSQVKWSEKGSYSSR